MLYNSSVMLTQMNTPLCENDFDEGSGSACVVEKAFVEK
jgi:hypothetical protein